MTVSVEAVSGTIGAVVPLGEMRDGVVDLSVAAGASLPARSPPGPRPFQRTVDDRDELET